MMLLKEESLPNPDMAMKENWYLDLLKDKSLLGGNSALLGEPSSGEAYFREKSQMKKAVLRGFTRNEKEEIHVFESNFHEMFASRPGATAKVELSVIPTSTEDYGPWQVQSTMPERDLWFTQAVIDRAQRTKTSAIILGGDSLLYDALARYCGEKQMPCELLGAEQGVIAATEEIEHASHVFFVPQGRESQGIDLMECLFRHRIEELSSMNPSVQPIAICACRIDQNQRDENLFYLMAISRLRRINFFTSFSSKDQLKKKYALYPTAPYECTGVCTTYSPCPVKKERLEFVKSDLYPCPRRSSLFAKDSFAKILSLFEYLKSAIWHQ